MVWRLSALKNRSMIERARPTKQTHRRFRPNIVVATGPDEQGFAENDWIGHAVAIGDQVRLQVTGPCPRCVMTTLPQGDLPKDSGILRTAAQHNQARLELARVSASRTRAPGRPARPVPGSLG